MKFERFTRSEGSSWALWEFNEHETQINNIYWASVASLSYSTYTVRNAPKHEDVPTILKATGPNATRFPANPKIWLTTTATLQDWTRGSFVMAATGALERYVQRAVLTALLSDPALIYGKSRAIDGIAWLKLGINVDHAFVLDTVTIGKWPQRYSAFKKIFGEVPLVKHHLAILEEIREFRNDVGHAFGRDLSHKLISDTRSPQKMQKLKQQRLIEWLGVMSEVAKALDEVLVANHIGDFEPMHYFYTWQQKHRCTSTRSPQVEKEFRKALGKEEGHSKGRSYVQELIAAYDAA